MRLLVVFAGLVLAGCTTPCADAITEPSTRGFECLDGSNLTVTFNPSPAYAHIVQDGFAPIDLPTDLTGSGYRYAQGGAELRGSFGLPAHWTRPGAAETVCREAR